MELGSEITIMGVKIASLSSASCVYDLLYSVLYVPRPVPLCSVDIVDHVAAVGDR